MAPVTASSVLWAAFAGLLMFGHLANPDLWLRAVVGFALTVLMLGAVIATFLAANLDPQPLIDIGKAFGIRGPGFS
jgi:hypothetical protein